MPRRSPKPQRKADPLERIAAALERVSDALLLRYQDKGSPQPAPRATYPVGNDYGTTTWDAPTVDGKVGTIADAQRAAEIGRLFIALRKEFWPQVVSEPDRNRLADEALQYAMMGATPEMARDVMSAVMRKAVAEGKGAPHELRFCRPSMERSCLMAKAKRGGT